MPRRRRVRLVGKATAYQKALITLRDRIDDEHLRLHHSRKLRIGGHIKLPLRHQFLHAAPAVLDVMLNTDLSNTFKPLSFNVQYHIDPEWNVYVVKRIRRSARKRK